MNPTQLAPTQATEPTTDDVPPPNHLLGVLNACLLVGFLWLVYLIGERTWRPSPLVDYAGQRGAMGLCATTVAAALAASFTVGRRRTVLLVLFSLLACVYLLRWYSPETEDITQRAGLNEQNLKRTHSQVNWRLFCQSHLRRKCSCPSIKKPCCGSPSLYY